MKKILFTALLALLAAGVGAQEQQKEEGAADRRFAGMTFSPT